MTPTHQDDARKRDAVLVDRLRAMFFYDNGFLRFRKSRGPRPAGSIAGFGDGHGYWRVKVGARLMQAHRAIFALHYGYLPVELDHINGVRDDNRIENLRVATKSENAWNTGLLPSNTSGVKGVHWYKRDNKWMARCGVNGRRQHLGYFDSLDDASDAVKAFRATNHGEFARHAVGVGFKGEAK